MESIEIVSEKTSKVETQKIYKSKTGVLLVNLGTPNSSSVADVRKYLREFLMDGRVIDIPFISRFALVNFIIAPFRSPKSAKVYKQLWTERGSPLKFYGEEIVSLLQAKLGDDYQVNLAMRYQNPSIEHGLNQLKNTGVDKIIVVPLFPQYASASTGSVYEKVMDVMKSWQIIPPLSFVGNFFDHPKFIKAFSEIGKTYKTNKQYDHYLFSYHGLPERQILKGDCTGVCLTNNCCDSIHALNHQCYRAQCFETTRLLVKQLGLSEGEYSTTFQSRLGKNPWIKPYTDLVIKELAEKGKKNILVFSPSFVSDCLETTIEIGEEYKELFEKNGGNHWQLVESLNNHPLWIETLEDLVKEKSSTFHN